MSSHPFLKVDHHLDPDFEIIRHQAKEFGLNAAFRAIALSGQEDRSLKPNNPIEEILVSRFKEITNLNPGKSLSKKQQYEREGIKERAFERLDRWAKKHDWYGNTSSDRQGVFRISSKRSNTISQKIKPSLEHINNDFSSILNCPELEHKLLYLHEKFVNNIPDNKDVHDWLKQILDIDYTPKNHPPAVTSLKVFIKEVKCIDITDGFLGSEAGTDEIVIAGQKIDEKGTITKISKKQIGDFEDDGDVKELDPLQFATFNLATDSTWPRSYVVTFLLVEADNGGISGFVKDLMKSTAKLIAEQLSAIAASINPILGAIMYVIAEIIVGAIIAAIIEAWEDDAFPPFTFAIPIQSPTDAAKIKHIDQNRWGTASFSGHGGMYQLKYSFQCY